MTAKNKRKNRSRSRKTSDVSLTNEFKKMFLNWLRNGEEEFPVKIIVIFSCVFCIVGFFILMLSGGMSYTKDPDVENLERRMREGIYKILPFMSDSRSDEEPVERFDAEQLPEKKVEEQPATKSEPEYKSDDDVIKKLKEIL